MRKASLLTIFLIVFIDLVGFGILLPNQQYYGELLGIHNVFFLTLIGPAYSFFQFLFAPSSAAGRIVSAAAPCCWSRRWARCWAI